MLTISRRRHSGTDLSDLSRGSVGIHDPFIGPVYLLEGHTYYVAVTNAASTADGRRPAAHPQLRLGADRFRSARGRGQHRQPERFRPRIPLPPYTLFPGTTAQDPKVLNLAAEPYHLGDVVCYVQSDGGLETVDAFTGAVETTLGNTTGTTGANAGDLAMVPGTNYTGTLYSITAAVVSPTADQNASAGVLCTLDTGTGTATAQQSDGIVTYRNSLTQAPPALDVAGDNNPAGEKGGVAMNAMVNISGTWYVIGNADGYTAPTTGNPVLTYPESPTRATSSTSSTATESRTTSAAAGAFPA